MATMNWDVEDSLTDIIIKNDTGYTNTINKEEVQVVLEAEDSYLRIKSSQSPYLDLAWWDETTISSLTGATTLADGEVLLSGYLKTNT